MSERIINQLLKKMGRMEDILETKKSRD